MGLRILFTVLLCSWSLTGCADIRDLMGLVEAIPAPAPVEQPRTLGANVCPESIDLIVNFEIVSPGYYARHLDRPIYPGGASGVTIGISYDLGHQVPTVIRTDWKDHQQAGLLPPAAGITGQRAKQQAAGMAQVITPYRLAEIVFYGSTLPRYWLATKRAYPGVEDMPGCVGGALLSLTYNRGTSMAGDRAREKRVIRDKCLPDRNPRCVADQIAAMKRLWAGTDLEKGLGRRRDAEAQVIWSM